MSDFESELENLFPYQGYKGVHLLFFLGLEWFHLHSQVSLVYFSGVRCT